MIFSITVGKIFFSANDNIIFVVFFICLFVLLRWNHKKKKAGIKEVKVEVAKVKAEADKDDKVSAYYDIYRKNIEGSDDFRGDTVLNLQQFTLFQDSLDGISFQRDGSLYNYYQEDYSRIVFDEMPLDATTEKGEMHYFSTTEALQFTRYFVWFIDDCTSKAIIPSLENYSSYRNAEDMEDIKSESKKEEFLEDLLKIPGVSKTLAVYISDEYEADCAKLGMATEEEISAIPSVTKKQAAAIKKKFG
jgi:hypothetical protein